MRDEKEVKILLSMNKELEMEKEEVDAQIIELCAKSSRLQDQIWGNMLWINYYASETTVNEEGSRHTTIPLVIE
jgi:hypothetical protein